MLIGPMRAPTDQPEVDVVALTITFGELRMHPFYAICLTSLASPSGNTGAPLAYANALKVYAQIERELAHDPAAAARYVGLERGANGRKTILAKGAEEPIDGVVEFAAYFVGGHRSRLICAQGRR